MTRGKQPLHQTGEVCMEGQKGAVLRSGDGRREGRNRKEQDGRSIEVADAIVYEGC